MNENLQRTWCESFQIMSLLVNPAGRLGLYGLLNLLQETAWMHAEKLGLGMKAMERQGQFWVLTRQTLDMQIWPHFNDKITIETWLRPPEGAFVCRDFNIKNAQDQTIGICSTSWLALDRTTKKPLPSEGLHLWKNICSQHSNGLINEKIPVQGTYEDLAKFRVRNSDLDVNEHVNNTKYAQWILDAIPYSLHKQLMLKKYSVNFLAETHLGDKVRIERSMASADSSTSPEGSTVYKGVRTQDEKILFTAQLDWEKINS